MWDVVAAYCWQAPQSALLLVMRQASMCGRTSTWAVTRAQDMTFPDASFHVIVSNLCLHNIYSSSQRSYALNHIVRVLKPGGVALISDYKHTREYAAYFSRANLIVSRKRGSLLTTFPPLTVVIARKPLTLITDSD